VVSNDLFVVGNDLFVVGDLGFIIGDLGFAKINNLAKIRHFINSKIQVL